MLNNIELTGQRIKLVGHIKISLRRRGVARQGFDVAPRQCAKQNKFQKFIIMQCHMAAATQELTQSFAVADKGGVFSFAGLFLFFVSHNVFFCSVLLNAVGRIQSAWRFGENFNTVSRYANGMFILRGKGPVAGDSGPSVAKNFHRRLAQIQHRLNGEKHAIAQNQPLAGTPVMQNVGRIVENTAKTVPAKITDNCESVNFGMLLNGEAYVS